MRAVPRVILLGGGSLFKLALSQKERLHTWRPPDWVTPARIARISVYTDRLFTLTYGTERET